MEIPVYKLLLVQCYAESIVGLDFPTYGVIRADLGAYSTVYESNTTPAQTLY
jgi:hypothetical protein